MKGNSLQVPTQCETNADPARFDNVYRHFCQDADRFFGKLRVFFRLHSYPVLLKRAGARVTLPDWADLWPTFRDKLAEVTWAHPEYFFDQCPYPFINVCLSVKLLRQGDIAPDRIQWMSDHGFIDCRAVNRTGLGDRLRLSVLGDIREHRHRLLDAGDYPQYPLRELLMALVDDYDKATGTIGDGWKARLARRAARKRDLEASYLSVLDTVWTPRQLSKVIRQAPAVPPRPARLSLRYWRALVQAQTANLCARSRTLDAVYEDLYQALLLPPGSRPGIDGLADELALAIAPVNKPFRLTADAIRERLYAALYGTAPDLDPRHPLFAAPLQRVRADRQRLGRMRLSRTTRRVYEQLLPADGLLRSINGDLDGLYRLHVALCRHGVNPNTIRSLLKALYGGKRLWQNGPTPAAHDTAFSVLPALFGCLAREPLPGKARVWNRLVTLITSHLAGGDIDVNLLHALRSLTPKLSRVTEADFTSLRGLVAWLGNDHQALTAALALADDHGLVCRPDDRDRVIGMGLSIPLRDHLQAVRAVPPSNAPVLEADHRGVRLAIVPHDHLLGILGAGVAGVCIPFDSPAHRQHVQPACRNLVVYDQARIYLWGLLVESDGGAFYLNNLQGGLPARYRQHKADLVHALRGLLARLGTVYTVAHYFNAVNLCDGLAKARGVTLTLPRMRLDIAQDPDGRVRDAVLYRVGKPDVSAQEDDGGNRA